MGKCSKCLNREKCINGANYNTAEKCNKYTHLSRNWNIISMVNRS